MQDMLRHAYVNNYAVGAISVVSLDLLQGVIAAAEKCRAPVIIGLAEPHLPSFDLALLAPAVEAAARRSNVPVAIHFDHGSGIESIQRGIAHGCNGVMVDGSHLPLHDNIDVTTRVVQMAHGCGIPVEAELGYVPDSGGELIFTTVEEARGFVRVTHVDFLAVSIGTAHGRLNGKPNLDYPRLRQINEALQIPLVLHGSSGLSDDQFRKLIAHGIAKVNYFTALSDLSAQQIGTNARSSDAGYLALFSGVRERVAQETERLMRVWGSAGRAAEVLTQCRPWQGLEHHITFTLNDVDAAEAELLLRRGRQVLRQIPGVCEVISSVALGETEPNCYRWQVRLASEAALEQLRNNAAFQHFSKRYLDTFSTALVSSSFLQEATGTP
jgi:fructose-bisphosphate aldolase class II